MQRSMLARSTSSHVKYWTSVHSSRHVATSALTPGVCAPLRTPATSQAVSYRLLSRNGGQKLGVGLITCGQRSLHNFSKVGFASLHS